MTTVDKHAGFCIKSLKNQVPVTDVPITEDFDFGTALETVYPLLDIIFSFLDYRDLKQVAKVSKVWEEIVDRVLSKRNAASWVSCFKPKKQTSNVVEFSSNLNRNNIGLGIILYNSRKIKLQNYICVHRNTSLLSMKTVVEYFADELVPENIEYCLISCPKVISYFPRENQKQINDSIFDGLFLPVIPNIRTAMFHCNPVKAKDLKASLEHFIKENETVKCLLMFCKNELRHSIYNLLDELIPGSNPSAVAVGGGIIRGTKTFQQVNTQKKVFSQNDVFCITFTQKKGEKSDFDAFSVVISGDDLSQQEFEDELTKFKNNIVLRTKSAAFRICCSAKMDTEDELFLFGKVFPGIPLLGLDADGEIGWNSYNGLETETANMGSKRLKRKYPEVQHQWSTVIVLITWGNLL